MVELILLVCALAEPDRCEEVYPSFQEPMSIAECMREGPLMAARWADAHPEWQIKGWVCGAPRA